MGRAGRTTIQGKYGDILKIVAVDENGNIVAVLQGVDGAGVLRTLKVDSDGQIISVIKGDQGIVAQDAANKLISVIQGSTGVAVAQDASNKLISVIQGSTGVAIAQDAANRLISVIKGSQGLDVAQQATTGELISVMKGLDGVTLRTVALDSSGNIVGVMKGNDAGTLRTIAVDSLGLMQSNVNKAEKIEIYSTVSTTHFTESIVMNAQETENITGLTANRYMVRAVNIQSVQPLKYRLIFWGKDTFNNTDPDVDSYIDDVELDMTASPAFRIDNANQYRLNVGALEILYEDYDITKELHISLQNLSSTAKLAGVSGAVQLDIKVSPRL